MVHKEGKEMSKRGRPKRWEHLDDLTPETLEDVANEILGLDERLCARRERRYEYPILTLWQQKNVKKHEFPSVFRPTLRIGDDIFSPKTP